MMNRLTPDFSNPNREFDCMPSLYDNALVYLSDAIGNIWFKNIRLKSEWVLVRVG